MLCTQVVNTGVRGALDEFVMLWVEEDINRQLGPNQEAITGATMQTLLEQTGQNLRVLVGNVADLVLHFADFQ